MNSDFYFSNEDSLISLNTNIYLHQGVYGFALVCLFDFLARLLKKLQTDFDETWWEGVERPKEVPIQFWRGSGSMGRSRIQFFHKSFFCDNSVNF